LGNFNSFICFNCH